MASRLRIWACCLFLTSAIASHAMAQTKPAMISNLFGAYNLTIEKRRPAEQVELLRSLGYQGMVFWWHAKQKFAEFDAFEAVPAIRDKSFPLVAALVGQKYDKPIDRELYRGLFERFARTNTAAWLMLDGPKGNDEAFVKVLQEICDLAAEQHVRVVFYPHHHNYVATVEDSLRILDLARRDNLTTSIHLCHELKAGNEKRLDEIIARVAPRLGLASISGAYLDADRQNDDWARAITPLDEGDVDTAGYVHSLAAHGYTGPVLLHTFGLKQKPEDHFARSATAWRKIVDGSR